MSAALHNIQRANLATTTLRVGMSYASLDLWYVDLDVRADARGSFRHWLSDDELGRAARLVFSDVERRELELAPDPVSAFLNGWTRKEAYVKALGLGLTAPLTEIIVSLSERAALLSAGLPGQSASNWRLLNVPHPRAVVAVALGPHLESTGAT